MASTRTPVLAFNTVVVQRTVEIDGKRYPFIHPDAISLFERLELDEVRQQLGAVMVKPKEKWTRADKKALPRLMDEFCRQVLKAPEDVHRRLHDAQRLQIIEAFIQLPQTHRPMAEAPAAVQTAGKMGRQSGKRSSRDSRGSTAAAQRRGLREPRSRYSAPAR